MEQIVLQRIAELWKWRAWYRQHNAMTLSWPVRWSNAAELRALVKLAREARRASRRSRQPVGVGFHDWQAERDGEPLTEPELLAGYGVATDFDREGDPAWNGAFSRW